MKYIDNSFAETAAALMILNPKCPVNFKSAASLEDRMKHVAEVELNGPGIASTFGFVITTFMSSDLEPVLCATASVSSGIAAKAAMTLTLVKAALQEIAKGQGAYNMDQLQHASNVIDEAKATANTALKWMEL